MLYLETLSGVFDPWTGEPLSGIVYPRSIQVLWTDEQLSAIGLYIPEPADAVAEGMVSTGQMVERVGGVVKFVHALTDVVPINLDARKTSIKEAIKLEGLNLRRQGFRWDFGTAEEPNPQVLQLREPTPQIDDEKNWLVSLTAYTAMVMMGQGNLPNAKFRTESNETFTLTYQDGMTVLLGLQAWASGLFNISWEKQATVDAAPDHATLDLVEAELAVGWGR